MGAPSPPYWSAPQAVTVPLACNAANAQSFDAIDVYPVAFGPPVPPCAADPQVATEPLADSAAKAWRLAASATYPAADGGASSHKAAVTQLLPHAEIRPDLRSAAKLPRVDATETTASVSLEMLQEPPEDAKPQQAMVPRRVRAAKAACGHSHRTHACEYGDVVRALGFDHQGLGRRNTQPMRTWFEKIST